MGGLKIDFSEVESQGPLPEGEYECVIEDVTVRESKSSDNDYLNWELKVLEEEYEDRRIWIGTSLSPRALFGLEEVLLALGIIDEDEDEGTSMDEIELEWDDDVDITPTEGPRVTNPEVIGLPCVASTVNSVYNKRERQDQWNSKIKPTGTAEGTAAVKQPGNKNKAAAKGKKAKAGSSRKRALR